MKDPLADSSSEHENSPGLLHAMFYPAFLIRKFQKPHQKKVHGKCIRIIFCLIKKIMMHESQVSLHA